jgi:hypothetical protein
VGLQAEALPADGALTRPHRTWGRPRESTSSVIINVLVLIGALHVPMCLQQLLWAVTVTTLGEGGTRSSRHPSALGLRGQRTLSIGKRR